MPVVFDLLAAQHRRGGPGRAAQLTTALARRLWERVDVWTARQALPQCAVVAEAAATGDLVLTHPGERPRPGDGGTFVTAALLAPDCDPGDVVPRRYASAHWHRVALVDEAAIATTVDADRRRVVDGFGTFLVTTAATRDHLVAQLGVAPGAVHVIGVGIDDHVRPDARDHEVVVSENHLAPPAPGVRARHVLVPYVRTGDGSLHRVIEAHAQLSPDARAVHQLVVVGVPSPGIATSLLDTAARAGLVPGDVCPLGPVSAETLRRLTGGAHLVVVPGVGDGVALSLREALSFGVPVVATRVATHETLLPASQLLDLGAPSAAGAYAGHVAERPPPGAVPADQGPWSDVAAAVVDRLGAIPAPPPEVARPRIALVTPAPGQHSGIADYAAKLLPTLTGAATVTVFADRVGDSRPVAGVRLEPTSRFDALDEREPFHHVVTMLGNSGFHIDALDLVRRHGGTVVLHDARLAALYSAAVDDDPGRVRGGRVGAALAYWYPGRYGDDLTAMTVIDPGTAADRGIDLLAEIAAAADEVLVHSDLAADTMWRDTRRRPIVAFGLPFDPPIPAAERNALRRSDHLVSVGGLTPVKQPELVVDALALLRRTRPVTLTFCGGGDAGQVQHLQDRADAAGVAEAVEITGRVDEAAYRATIASAAVAVQLRAFTNGESSAALHDTIAAGVPTVASRVGTMAGYPDDVVITVPPHATAEVLADALGALLDDEPRRLAMEEAARRYAAARPYETVAAALLERLRGGCG